MTRDPRVDAYIAKQAPFAHPILERLREAVHSACPVAVEDIKWSAPAFMYKGEILAMMAAFKQHAAFNLWRGKQVVEAKAGEGMGQFGRLTSVEDIPEQAAIDDMIRKAMDLVDSGVKPLKEKKSEPKPPPEAPEDLKAALAENSAAAGTFESFSPSAKRDYVDWIVGAKSEATRQKRLAQAVEWMAEGKKRNWKYERC